MDQILFTQLKHQKTKKWFVKNFNFVLLLIKIDLNTSSSSPLVGILPVFLYCSLIVVGTLWTRTSSFGPHLSVGILPLGSPSLLVFDRGSIFIRSTWSFHSFRLILLNLAMSCTLHWRRMPMLGIVLCRVFSTILMCASPLF